ncbi:MIOREX complex component 11 [Nakaseomyces glabratus]|uniref:MIOREX complex component 11 n=1 Tax=Candida glabrata TaxID=5478 RepID=A0A0W0CIM1_CANGB|nr:MIOREX complex component 11 [Nakaseomyces glabratus]KTB02456.1 MIOREX complex component 11 [Nakaseomyces glabratus]KTB02871.1 MIOREX complex component 11 [Nakaseomyces glabratus]KTB08860.1 MIOREX complex component 11 [Nakaseomyces glabratus]KTB18989.1 MIOREX complex component 11 [Nakaseomyces glabratus]
MFWIKTSPQLSKATDNILPRFTYVQRSLVRNSIVKRPFSRNNPVFSAETDKYKDKLHKIINNSRLLSRLNKNPRFHQYFNTVSETGTITTLTSFLVLHELTAIVPLFGMWWVIYNLDIHNDLELPGYLSDLLERCSKAIDKIVGDKYGQDLDRHRLILSGAISYTIVKLLYPLRIILSIWWAPHCGRFIVTPIRKLLKYLKPK